MELQLTQEIEASADKVWDVLGHRFAEVADWAPNIEWSRVLELNEMPHGFRVAKSAPIPGRVTPNPLGDIIEVLTMYSDENKSFTFEANGPSPLFSHTQNTTRVVALEAGKCLVTFDLRLTPKGIFNLFTPILKRRFQTSKFGPAGVIKDLKVFVENNSL